MIVQQSTPLMGVDNSILTKNMLSDSISDLSGTGIPAVHGGLFVYDCSYIF